jgi:anti-sigma regulatory factor (Ser/Thr protein kinase)
MPEPTPEVITLRLPSRLELLSVLDRVTLLVCERMGLDEDASSMFSMSVLEAGTNAVQHGHKKDPSKVFQTEFRMHPDRLEVVVSDQGGGFDLAPTEHDITSPEHLLDSRGRGIFILRSSCDAVNFEISEHGTVCRLVKFRSAAPRAADA